MKGTAASWVSLAMDYIDDAPTARPATLNSVLEGDLAEIEILAKYGGLLIDPPRDWVGTEMDLEQHARFKTKNQELLFPLLVRDQHGYQELSKIPDSVGTIYLKQLRREVMPTELDSEVKSGNYKSFEEKNFRFIRKKRKEPLRVKYAIDIDADLADAAGCDFSWKRQKNWDI